MPSADCDGLKNRAAKFKRLQISHRSNLAILPSNLNPGARHPRLDQKLARLVVYLFDFVVFGVA